MGREIIYRCDKCGVWINKADVEINGQAENNTFLISSRKEDSIIFMCQKCWADFEKVYNKFISKKAINNDND